MPAQHFQLQLGVLGSILPRNHVSSTIRQNIWLPGRPSPQIWPKGTKWWFHVHPHLTEHFSPPEYHRVRAKKGKHMDRLSSSLCSFTVLVSYLHGCRILSRIQYKTINQAIEKASVYFFASLISPFIWIYLAWWINHHHTDIHLEAAVNGAVVLVALAHDKVEVTYAPSAP